MCGDGIGYNGLYIFMFYDMKLIVFLDRCNVWFDSYFIYKKREIIFWE